MKGKNKLQVWQLLLFILIVFMTSSIAFSAVPLTESQLKEITGLCECYERVLKPCPGQWQICSLDKYCYYCENSYPVDWGCKGQDSGPLKDCQLGSLQDCAALYRGICVLTTKGGELGDYCDDGDQVGWCTWIHPTCDDPEV